MPDWDRPSLPAEDPSVAIVEQILDAAASRDRRMVPLPDGRVVAQHALWICACVSSDDAPTWLIYDDPGGEIAWVRVLDQAEPLDLVDAQLSAGGHADPAEVLRWLEGEATDPWAAGGAGWGDLAAIEELGRKIRRR